MSPIKLPLISLTFILFCKTAITTYCSPPKYPSQSIRSYSNLSTSILHVSFKSLSFIDCPSNFFKMWFLPLYTGVPIKRGILCIHFSIASWRLCYVINRLIDGLEACDCSRILYAHWFMYSCIAVDIWQRWLEQREGVKGWNNEAMNIMGRKTTMMDSFWLKKENKKAALEVTFICVTSLQPAWANQP